MKLQYLGDARDSFKWDLLHFLVTDSTFERLCFVPFLTPDDPDPTDGRTPPHLFPCRPEILNFNERLRKSRDLNLVTQLGRLGGVWEFGVGVFYPERYVGVGKNRHKYLEDLNPKSLKKTLVFFDPDNGFETKTQKGIKWIRHEEIKHVLADLPASSAIVVYQHRPRRRWTDLLPKLRVRCHYAQHLLAIYEANLAFVLLTKGKGIHERLVEASERYVQSRMSHPLSLWLREK